MWQVIINTTQEQACIIESLLEDSEILSFTMSNAGEDIIIEQVLHEKPIWTYVKLEVLVDNLAAAEKLKNDLFALNEQLAVEITEVVQKNWLVYGLKDFKPMLFGDKLWVYPHWLVPDNRPETSIILDPGFAFGTGQHETTKMCLQWLATNPIDTKQVIDYGCGSGILGLAAVKLGAAKVYGLDIDEQAIAATMQNAKLNCVDNHKFYITVQPDELPGQVDIIIANIVMNPLLKLRDYFANKLHSQGTLVLSGILLSQKEQLLRHYSERFKLREQFQDKEWCCLSFDLCRNFNLND